MISEDQADQQKGKGAAAAAAKQVSRTVVVVVERKREREAEESSAELTPGASPTSVQSYRQTDRQTDQLRERTESTLSHSADLHMRLAGNSKHLQQISLDFPRRHNRAPR